MLNLDIPHRNFSVCNDIQNKYLGITFDETNTIEISEDQFKTCQKANGHFCILNTPLLPLANPPTCISALYSKDKGSIQKRCSLWIKKASSISIPTPIAPNYYLINSRAQNYHTADTHTYTLTTTTMWHHITAFSPATML